MDSLSNVRNSERGASLCENARKNSLNKEGLFMKVVGST
jgi:hypothetical protein